MRRLLLIGAAILLGILCEAGVRGKPIDTGFPGYLIICLVVGFLVLWAYDPPTLPSRRSYWLFIPPVYFAITASLTAQWPASLKYNLSLGFTFLYLALLTITYTGGRLYDFSMFDYLDNLKRLVIDIILLPIQFFRDWRQGDPFPGSRKTSTDGVSLMYAGRIGFWVFAALFSLFLLADLAFRQFFFNNFWENNPLRSIWHVLLWSYIILGIFLYAIYRSQNKDLYVDYPLVYFRRWVCFNHTDRVMCGLFIPLVAFAAIRIYTVLGILHFENPTLTGIEQKYGFWALAAASGIVFLAVCWLNHVTDYYDERERRIHTYLYLLLFGLVFFVMVVAWWSFTINTTLGIHKMQHVWYARGGLVWLGTMFAMFIGFEHNHRECEYPFYALLLTTGMVGVFTLVGSFIATV